MTVVAVTLGVVDVNVAGTVRSSTLELDSAEIWDSTDDTETDSTVVEVVGTGISVMSESTDVAAGVETIVMSTTLELG